MHRRAGTIVLSALLLVLTATDAQAMPLNIPVGPEAVTNAPEDAGAGPLDTPADQAAGARFEARIADFLHYGQVHEQYYNTGEQRPGDIETLVGENDSALYTGNYLAAESFRFGVATTKLAAARTALAEHDARPAGRGDAGIPGKLRRDITYWSSEQAEALRRTRTIAAQFHILTNISENWYGDPNLRVGGKSVDGSNCQEEWSGENTPDDPAEESECDESLPEELAHDVEDEEYQRGGWIDFGGGVLTGGTTPLNEPQPGLLFRYCSPVDAPTAFNAGRNPHYNRLAADLAWDNDGDGTIEDGEAQHCIGATSRDAYAGVTFGLATALDLVGPVDPDLQAMIAHDLMVMTDYALRYYWTAPRSHGRVVIPEVFDGNTLDNFYQPDMFFQVPLHRLNMLQVAKHAAEVVGDADAVARYEVLWLEEVALELPLLMGEMLVDDADHYAGYYKYHLHHMAGFNLIRLEDDPILRAEFMRGFGVMDRVTRHDVNAMYEAITWALTGEQDRLDDAVVHHRQWLDYFANQEASNHYVENSTKCGTELECVPDWSRPVTIGEGAASVTVESAPYNGLAGQLEAAATGSTYEPKLRAATALPVAMRRQGDFMWQKNPTELDGGPNSDRYAAPGADFLLPYWMLRYHTEVEIPPLTPFNAPPTPIFH